MTLSEIYSKTVAELEVYLNELKEESFKLNMLHATGQLEKTHRLSQLKRNVARVLTIMNQKRAG